jgi:hypothetical protein
MNPTTHYGYCSVGCFVTTEHTESTESAKPNQYLLFSVTFVFSVVRHSELDFGHLDEI